MSKLAEDMALRSQGRICSGPRLTPVGKLIQLAYKHLPPDGGKNVETQHTQLKRSWVLTTVLAN